MRQDSAVEDEKLQVDECWRLLGTARLGRLATTAVDAGESTVDIFPVNFRVHDRAIWFRSGPGSKLVDITANPPVAFEADGRRGRSYWSVVVHGSASRMGMDRDIEASGVLGLDATHPTDKWNYVRIEVASISGIKFRHRRRSGR